MYSVYVSAPLKANEQCSVRDNVRRANKAANRLMMEYMEKYGPQSFLLPCIVVPHKLMMGLSYTMEEEINRWYGMRCAMGILSWCDEIVVAGTVITDGMKQEIAMMTGLRKGITMRPDLIRGDD